MKRSALVSFGVLAAALTHGASEGTAHAQAAAPGPAMPAETVKANTATKGSTDVAKGGFVTAGAQPDADAAKDATEFAISAGGLFSSGNARTIAVTSLAKGRVRRDASQFSGALTGNFARAGKRTTPVETTVENVQGLLRYDYFVSERVSLFLQGTGRRDRFQGLDLRLNVDPGIAYYFLNEKERRLNIELGYDLQHDIRRSDALLAADAAPGTAPLDKTQTLHNGRAFVGFDTKVYKEAAFNVSLEYIQALKDIDTYRLIFDIGLKTNVAEKLAIATTYTMRYENRPLPDVGKADSIASVSLVYTLF